MATDADTTPQDAPRPQGKKLSPARRALGCGAVLLSIAVGIGVGFFLMMALTGGGPKDLPEEGGVLLHVIAMGLLGTVSLGVGTMGYFVVVLTRCFTSDFNKPFWDRLQTKLFLANIVVPLFIVVGVSCYVSMVVTPLLQEFAGVEGLPAFVFPFLVTCILLQLALVSMDIWTPLLKSATRMRLLTRGVLPDDLRAGSYTGISDPEKSSAKKRFIEEDLGVLWLHEDAMCYRGDTEDFSVRREELIEVQRESNPWSWAAYWGAVDVLIRVRIGEEGERRIRLHPMGSWTLLGVGKADDRLAEAIEAWRAASPVAPPAIQE